MNLRPVPIVGGCYADDTRPYSAQDCVNWIPERAEVAGGRSDGILRSAPGLVELGGDLDSAHNGITAALFDFNTSADEQTGNTVWALAGGSEAFTISTAIKKFGAGSAQADAAVYAYDQNKYMRSYSFGSGGTHELGTRNFCMSGWFYIAADWTSFGNRGLFGDDESPSYISVNHLTTGGTNGTFVMDIGASSVAHQQTLSLATWYHVALTREGNVFRLFVNGVKATTDITDSISYSSHLTGGLNVGKGGGWSYPFKGNYDDFRIVLDDPVYTANFTAPTTELTASATSGYCRALRNVEGALYAVIGTSLYKVETDGSKSVLGTIPGTTRCSMTHNQITNGNEIVVVNGSQGFVYNSATNLFAQITDDAFEGSIITAYLNQYILHVESGRRYWFHSDLADAKQYISLDRYEGESNPDRMVSLLVDHQEVWVFNERSIDLFVNSVSESAAFERASGTSIEIGCASTFSPAKCDNSVFWLGNDGIFYRANGYSPMRISTHAIESAINDLDWSQCYSMVWEDRGHKVVYWTFPDGQTWGYDVATQTWHRRKSFGFDNWRVNHCVYWNGQWIAGDAYSGKLYTLDWNTFTEDGDPIERIRVTGVTHSNQNRFRVDAVEAVVSVGEAAQADTDFTLELCWSDDGGYTYGNWQGRSLGAVGAYYTRLLWRRLGMARHRTWKVRCTSPVKCDLIAASASMQV